MIRLWISLVLLSGCGQFGWSGTPRGSERRAARNYLPSEIGPRANSDAKTRKLAVRVWAEPDFQRLTLDWQVRFSNQLDRSNEVLRATLGIELEVVQLKAWPVQGQLVNLDAALFDLSRFDPGEDVDLVIGLVTPLAATSLHDLGRAYLFGKHLVMRGTDDAEEARQFAEVFGLVSNEELNSVYRARTRHKEEVLLLHEIGHLLGALHVAIPSDIMHAEYDQDIAGFSPVDLEIMAIGLRERSAPVKTEMISYLTQTTFDGFMGSERVKMIGLLRGDPARLARASETAVAEDVKPGEPPRASDPIRDANKLAMDGQDREAWILLEPLLREHPEDSMLVNLSCGVAARLETATTAEALCRRAVELEAEDPRPALYLAYVLVNGARDGSAEIAEAERRLSAAKVALPDAWGFLARIHQIALSPTFAERAAAKMEGTGEARSVLKWAKDIREDFGLAEGALPPEREGEYLRSRYALNHLIEKKQLAEAKRFADELSKKFPNLPGADRSLCWLLVSERSHTKALGHCGRAIQAEPKSVELRILIAYAAFGARKPGVAVPHLERAIAMDPKKKDAWSLLGAAYQFTGRRDELADLRGRYLQRFGEQLR